MQIETRNTKCFSGFDGQLRGADHLVGGGRIDQVAVQVSRHRREVRASGGECGQILVVPAPDLDGEAHVVDPAHPIDDR